MLLSVCPRQEQLCVYLLLRQHLFSECFTKDLRFSVEEMIFDTNGCFLDTQVYKGSGKTAGAVAG